MPSEHPLQTLLNLRRPPVAVTFVDSAPVGVPRIERAGPSSCAYWKLAAEGRTFCTEAADHGNCPIGAYTHGVALSAQGKKELEEVVSTMISLGYLRAEEVPSISHRQSPFALAVYAPLAESVGEPDVVIISGNAKQVMLLSEATGVGSTGLMGRPTCAALPVAMQSGQGVSSLGCIGNRVYTEQADDELYVVLPGRQVNWVTERLAVIVHANKELEAYHRQRCAR
jgi:uncharacterized protein (DUF169 family)